ncbi:immunity 49 family protein [Streptomyces sp. ISL-11]|uniref:immunity 49 family protein n=1 Tax=Streptomyces sp. ISL-11 TaxID=2819174 RepID=UPI001BE52B85|nr:immunity 49 family protein [Streptomyces sp. ISL-11]MBT2384061.1 immunity 49 family protein [Streptomyces sp. ISL-11]
MQTQTTHIARHTVADARVTAAVDDFASRIGRQVDLMQHSEGRDAFGWEMIADEFLDYVGALSLAAPDLPSKEAHEALRAAADAARGVVALDVYQWESVHVFIDYVNFGLTYGPADDPRQDLGASDWLRALHLAIICDRYDAEAVTFGETAQALRTDVGAPLWKRAASGLAYGLLAYVRGYDYDEDDRYGDEPINRAEAAARLDALIAEATGTDTGTSTGTSTDTGTDTRTDAWRTAELSTVRALLTGDRDAFRDGLIRMLDRHREVNSGPTASPRSLLPLDAIALAALATRREGWEPGIESAYLPETLVTGRRTAGPRVGPYGQDKNPAALAELTAGRSLTIARPPAGWTPPSEEVVFDRIAAKQLAELADPEADLHLATRMLPSTMRYETLRFQGRSYFDPDGSDPRQREALTLAAELGAAAFRTTTATSAEDSVDVVVGGVALSLPHVGPQRDARAAEWTTAVEAALAAGARDALDHLLAVDPATFAGEDRTGVTTTYRAALHDHLRGADARPATDRALAARTRLLGRGGDFLCPPAVLLSQLVAGDAEGFALALADALEEHRDHYSVGDRADGVDALIGLDVLALACRARALGLPVPVRSEYLPAAIVEAHAPRRPVA